MVCRQKPVDTRRLRRGEVVVSSCPPTGTWRHQAWWRVRPKDHASPVLPLWTRLDGPGVCIGWQGEEGKARWAVALTVDDLMAAAQDLDRETRPSPAFIRWLRRFFHRSKRDVPLGLNTGQERT